MTVPLPFCDMPRYALASLATLACLAAGLLATPAAQATENPGAAALTWAEAHAAGHPYTWGGIPSALDSLALSDQGWIGPAPVLSTQTSRKGSMFLDIMG